jgi:hypothetical protein
MTGAGGIDYGKPPMAQTDLISGSIDVFRSPYTFVVAAAMLHAPKHGADLLFWV